MNGAKIQIDGYHAGLAPNASRSKEIDGPSQLVGRFALHLILYLLFEISHELIEGSCQTMNNQRHCTTTQRIPRPGSYRCPRDLSVTALEGFRDGSAPLVDEHDRPSDGRAGF